MAQTLSLRRLWKVYKQTMVDAGTADRRQVALARDAFYSGAQGVLMVLDHLAQHGRIEEMHDTLRGGEARSFQGRGTDLLGVLDIAPLH